MLLLEPDKRLRHRCNRFLQTSDNLEILAIFLSHGFSHQLEKWRECVKFQPHTDHRRKNTQPVCFRRDHVSAFDRVCVYKIVFVVAVVCVCRLIVCTCRTGSANYTYYCQYLFNKVLRKKSFAVGDRLASFWLAKLKLKREMAIVIASLFCVCYSCHSR